MSEAYIRHAKRQLKRWSRTGFVFGKAETFPLPDNSQDAVTSIFLLHELPPKIRRIVFSECARVLKPGGRLVNCALIASDKCRYRRLRAISTPLEQ